MFVGTFDVAIARLQEMIAEGTWRSDDIIILDNWTYREVVREAEYISDVPIDNEMAREVWAMVSDKVRDYEYLDNDIISNEIAEILYEDEEE